MDALDNKERFLRIYNSYIKREGAAAFLDWIEKSDFFTAPASTKFHLACEGGLCEHSINVYNNLKMLIEKEKELHPEKVKDISEESIAITGLLHDVCKINFYKIDYKNTKINGAWESVPYYTIQDAFPMGHGEKSVYIINRFMRLDGKEALAINWHMGGFDKRAANGDKTISEAYEKCPLAVLLQAADFISSYIDEIR